MLDQGDSTFMRVCLLAMDTKNGLGGEDFDFFRVVEGAIFFSFFFRCYDMA